MNTLLIVLSLLLALAGIAGAVVPGLPGPPLGWVGMLLLYLSTAGSLSPALLIAFGIAAAAITVLDYTIPSHSTKRHSGSKAGVWGCNIGLVISIIGLPFGPQGLAGVVLYPFLCAFAGELIGGKKVRQALRAAWGAFVGFLAGTGLKLAYGLAAAFMIIRDLFV